MKATVWCAISFAAPASEAPLKTASLVEITLRSMIIGARVIIASTWTQAPKHARIALTTVATVLLVFVIPVRMALV